MKKNEKQELRLELGLNFWRVLELDGEGSHFVGSICRESGAFFMDKHYEGWLSPESMYKLWYTGWMLEQGHEDQVHNGEIVVQDPAPKMERPKFDVDLDGPHIGWDKLKGF